MATIEQVLESGYASKKCDAQTKTGPHAGGPV
jgi:hypothetical protein